MTTLHLPVQGSVDRSKLLERVFVQVTDIGTDGKSHPVFRPLSGNGGMPADPAWYRGPQAPGHLGEWLRATRPLPRRRRR